MKTESRMSAFSVYFIFHSGFWIGRWLTESRKHPFFEFSFIHLLEKFSLSLWMEIICDSYWFCFLSNENGNSTKTSQSLESFNRHPNPHTLLNPWKKKLHQITLVCDNIDLWVASAAIYLLKVNNRNTRTRYEICSKLAIKTPKRRHCRRSGVFIVNFEHISHLCLVFLLLTLNMWLPAGKIHVFECYFI